jgi:urease subunit gamma/beta
LRRYGVPIATNSISVVRLTEREQDRLLIFSAAELARRHRAAGLKLSAPEAVALMCDAMFEAARAGASYAETEAAGQGAVAVDEVMDPVPALVDEVRLEVLLGDGTRLIVLRHPLGAPEGIDSAATAIPMRSDREHRTLSVTNTGTRVIRVSSHYPFDQVNARLVFDRAAAHGFRLDIAAGSTVRWEPGETREVTLVKAEG